ncbi:Predicted ATPase, AAA+ ATPase superfamily [Chitinophaga sp. CF118]|uniref:ATP-binding protein n=1 Tax=Chitinophaga sp. CF118 TaxID=1884367 RepID=UPI0008E3D83E|nr:ATP-binding protein [Chitinophaga sp. CF118]SFE41412.1 Predicted ATPase, AAA+ ATPase superfamily [Chitinophaga sp. CF118]
MKNIIGSPARGHNFYERGREVKKITDSLRNGNNIQITAPRRVGKTSILLHLLDNDIAGHHYVYVDTENITDEQSFYQKLLMEILKNDKISGSRQLIAGFKNGTNRFFRKIKSIQLLNTGIAFNNESPERDYCDEFEDFLTGYAGAEDAELVILIDEFPQTIENIRKNSEQSAIQFLQRKRALRLNPEISKKVKFIYTGSIGLNQTVSVLSATATINDLNSIEVGPLSETEAKDLFRKLLESNTRIVHSSAEECLQEVLQWYIPFHIQLLVQEIVNNTADNDLITVAVVEKALNKIIDLRYKNHFDHYYTRLKTHFTDESFKYANAVLKEIAEKNAVNKKILGELALQYQVTEHRHIIESLLYDGYIYFEDATRFYRFNSPILQRWWLKFICET